MNFLLTNDDGIWAEGLLTMAAEIKKIGKVLIVARDREQSATSHSLTLHRPLRINKIEADRYDGERSFMRPALDTARFIWLLWRSFWW